MTATARRWSLSALASLAVFASGCGGCDENLPGGLPAASFDILEEGIGAASMLPVEPLITGTRIVTSTNGYRSVLGPRADGVIEVLVGNNAGGEAVFWQYRRGEHGIELLGATNDKPEHALVVVPTQLRFGMSWRTGGGEGVTFAVTARSEEVTSLGPGVVWTIEAAATTTHYLEGVGEISDAQRQATTMERLPAFVPVADDPAPVPAVSSVAPSEIERFGDYMNATGLTGAELADGSMSVIARTYTIYQYSDEIEITCRSFRAGTFGELANAFEGGCIGGNLDSDGNPTRNPARTDGSGVHPGITSVMRRDGGGFPRPFATPGEGILGLTQLVFADDAQGVPKVLAYDSRLAFYWIHTGEFGQVTGNLLNTAVNRWDKGALLTFGANPMWRPGLAYWLRPEAARSAADGFRAYHVTMGGVLMRVDVQDDLVDSPQLLFPVPHPLSIKTTLDGHHEAVMAAPDGTISRLVLEDGAERLEALGRVTLPRGRSLVYAMEATDRPGDFLLLVMEAVAKPGKPWLFWMRATLGSRGVRADMPPALAVHAVRTGADVLVCWAATTAPFVGTGWTLAGNAATATELPGAHCALVRRRLTALATELTRTDGYTVHGPVPGIGTMTIAPAVAVASSNPEPGFDGNGTYSVFDWAGRHVGSTGFYPGNPSARDDLEGRWFMNNAVLPYLIHMGAESAFVRLPGTFAGAISFDVVGPVMGGGAAMRVRTSSTDVGAIHHVRVDGTMTPLAPYGPTGTSFWFTDGRHCRPGGTFACYASDGTTLQFQASPGGVTDLFSFGDGTFLAMVGTQAYRFDRGAQTLTLIGSDAIQRVARSEDGSLWGVVSGTWTLVKITPTALVAHPITPPAWIGPGATISNLIPGPGVIALVIHDGAQVFQLRVDRP